MKRVLALLALVVAVWQLLDQPGSVTLGPGVKAPDVPQQTMLAEPVVLQRDGYTVTELATFAIRAKVLSRKDYSFGQQADLSPVDLALGWGRMSDEAVLEKIDIRQSGRFYRWRTESFPIPRREIETHSANMHLIPADAAIEAALRDVRQGEIVEIEGSLVTVESNDGNWRWSSSMTRDDTGNGACELILVKRLGTASAVRR